MPSWPSRKRQGPAFRRPCNRYGNVLGELRQVGLFKDLIFDVPTLISTLSKAMTLLPGDIIATGTPVGVGIGHSPPKFLQHGDLVRVTVTGLGELNNRVRAK